MIDQKLRGAERINDKKWSFGRTVRGQRNGSCNRELNLEVRGPIPKRPTSRQKIRGCEQKKENLTWGAARGHSDETNDTYEILSIFQK